jgi:hypothetical protein
VRAARIGADAVVVDDVLDPDDFAALGRELGLGRYESVHARGWDRAWRFGDGAPLRGGAVYFDPTGSLDRPGVRYPTSSVVDTFIDALRALAVEHADVVGHEGSDWTTIFLSPWLYPVGSALSLHRDGGAYSGAFTYFAHPAWGVHWGGDLVVLDDDGSATSQAALGSLGWIQEDEVGTALGTCVFPRPNRLAFLGPQRPHLITRVDPNAGDHVQTSLAGFFLRP